MQVKSHVDPLAVRSILAESDIVTNIEARPLEVITASELSVRHGIMAQYP